MGHTNRILCALALNAVVSTLLACAAPSQPVLLTPTNTRLASTPVPTPKPPETAEPAPWDEARKLIWEEIVRAEDRALAEAERRIPYPYHEHLEVGSTHHLSAGFHLMPEIPPGEPLSLTFFDEVQSIPSGSTVLVLDVAGVEDSPWYHVQVVGVGEGWVNSPALYSSFEQENEQRLLERIEMEGILIEEHRDALAQRHGLTREQLHKIEREGILKGWWSHDRV